MFESWPATGLSASGADAPPAHAAPAPAPQGGWHKLARCLPGLGPVGCLYPRTLALPHASAGLRAVSPELFGIAQACAIAGGRWRLPGACVDVVLLLDILDEPLLGLVALPDTDYFAWDRMRRDAGLTGRRRRWRAPDGWLLGARCFELDDTDDPSCLSACAVVRLSALARSRIERLSTASRCIADPGAGRLRAC